MSTTLVTFPDESTYTLAAISRGTLLGGGIGGMITRIGAGGAMKTPLLSRARARAAMHSGLSIGLNVGWRGDVAFAAAGVLAEPEAQP